MTGTQTHFTAQGLVIKEMRVGENDRLVTLFTKEYGIIKAYVPGAKNIKSRRANATSMLTYSNFSINQKNGINRISEASVISSFFTVGEDIEALSLAQYFCELSSVFVQPMTTNTEFLRLILNSLHFITKEKKYLPFVKAVTEFRIAVISGYMPNLVACNECGKYEDDTMYFDIRNGQIFCSGCVKSKSDKIVLNRTTLSALRHIAFSEFGKIYSFSISEKSADNLSKITEKYLTVQTDHRFTALDFYNSL